jgi:Fe-S-cluster-containing dehydrogenase component
MKKWNLIIDVDKCEDCNNCILACKDEFVDNVFEGYSVQQPKHGHRWIDILKKERGQYPVIDVSYLPVPCFQCDDAPCVKAAKEGAVYKRKDGIVMIDPLKAKNQPEIVKSCPYGAIWWNESENLAQKCTLCAHLLDDNWKEPRCVTVCPTAALKIEHVEDSQMQKLVETEALDHYKSKHNTKPRVHYKNLHRFTKCFLAGSVAVTVDGLTDCVGNADVTLQDATGNTLAEMKTDGFGDFKFENLPANSGAYVINIRHAELGEQKVEVELKDSLYIGVISLSA